MLITTTPESFTWNFAPSLVAMLLSQAMLYGYLLFTARQDGRWGTAVKLRHPVWFALGLLILVVALMSPLDDISNRASFAAHMVQHILLAVIAPICLLWGTPAYWLRALFEIRFLKSALRFITHPLVAVLTFNFVLWVWHLPALYQAALRDTNIHIIEHLMFMATGVQLWLPIVHAAPPDKPLNYLTKIAYLFFTMVSSSILAALFTFARTVAYPFYGDAMGVFGLTALDDQQLAGAIMWVPGGGIFLAAVLITFAAWLTNEDRKGQAKYPPPPAAV